MLSSDCILGNVGGAKEGGGGLDLGGGGIDPLYLFLTLILQSFQTREDKDPRIFMYSTICESNILSAGTDSS